MAENQNRPEQEPSNKRRLAIKFETPNPARTDKPYTHQLGDAIRGTVDFWQQRHDDAAAFAARHGLPPATADDLRKAAVRELEAIYNASQPMAIARNRQLAFMSHLERCARANDPALPFTNMIRQAGGAEGMGVEDIARILPAWQQRTAGAKPTDGRRGKAGKYKLLVALFKSRWGDDCDDDSLRKLWEGRPGVEFRKRHPAIRKRNP